MAKISSCLLNPAEGLPVPGSGQRLCRNTPVRLGRLQGGRKPREGGAPHDQQFVIVGWAKFFRGIDRDGQYEWGGRSRLRGKKKQGVLSHSGATKAPRMGGVYRATAIEVRRLTVTTSEGGVAFCAPPHVARCIGDNYPRQRVPGNSSFHAIPTHVWSRGFVLSAQTDGNLAQRHVRPHFLGPAPIIKARCTPPDPWDVLLSPENSLRKSRLAVTRCHA